MNHAMAFFDGMSRMFFGVVFFFFFSSLVSFGMTYLSRVGTGRPMTGRSACDSCGHVLSPQELVPVFSWLACSGRCSVCWSPLDSGMFLSEAYAGIAGFSLGWIIAPVVGSPVFIVFSAMLLSGGLGILFTG